MVLVDTSVIIDYLRGSDNPPAAAFQKILDNDITFGINPFIYQEVLQGVKTEQQFTLVKEYLESQRWYFLKDWKESFAAAAGIYFACRRKGITIRSTIDCLIMQTAIENDLFLLHNDADFDAACMVVPLKVFPKGAAV